MLENVELSSEDRRRLKIYAAQRNETMKDLLLYEAHQIIDTDSIVPLVDRANDYVTLIIDVPEDFKADIKQFCNQKEIRIRDLWVESCRRILEGYDEITN